MSDSSSASRSTAPTATPTRDAAHEVCTSTPPSSPAVDAKDSVHVEAGSAAEGTAEALSFEQERLRLEAEHLALERDKLAVEQEAFELRQATAPDPDTLYFSIKALCAVAATCLLFGLIIGLSTGIDLGRQQTPTARKIQVSRQFVELMNSFKGMTPARPPFRETPTWRRLRHESQHQSVILIR